MRKQKENEALRYWYGVIQLRVQGLQSAGCAFYDGRPYKRDGSNWYAYVNNDPVNWIDPWGLLQIYGDDVNGRPIVVFPGQSPKFGSETAVNNLITVQQMTREAEIYQMGGAGKYEENALPNTTYCNLATFDIAEATGFNTDALFGENSRNGKDRDNTNANMAAQNLVTAAANRTVTQVSAEQAYTLANAGYTVIAAWENTSGGKGHLATVSPDFSGSNTLMISNVGENNGIMSVSRAFGANNTPQYYYDPNQRFTFDTSNILKTNAKPKKNN